MKNSDAIWDQMVDFVRGTRKLETTLAVLDWDQQTYLPPAASAYRSEQVGVLAGMIHRRQTDSQLQGWLEALAGVFPAESDVDPRGAAVAELWRVAEKRARLPAALVEETARVCSQAQSVWALARRSSDFALFAPHLETIFRLKREAADAIGYEDCRYDALLDDYEPRARTRDVAAILAALKAQLVPLVRAAAEASDPPDTSVLSRRYPRPAQEALAREVAAAIGFDFQRGRLDTTAHPFCTALGPDDCRLTTRYDEAYFPTAFFGVLHEAGHGLYEQGLPREYFGLPPGEACSLGLHESQSRLWENLVGRSRSFWDYAFPQAQRMFPEALSEVPLDRFYRAVNAVAPSLIRVEADETTYNLHIVIRFELERDLLEGRLSVSDLPEAWNEQYARTLGVRPPRDAVGVLQDIHWSGGLIGYFPTYALGTIYASQLFDAARRSIGDLDAALAKGDFKPLLEWLRAHVHAYGHRVPSAELIRRATGSPPDSGALLRHLRQKVESVYAAATT